MGQIDGIGEVRTKFARDLLRLLRRQHLHALQDGQQSFDALDRHRPVQKPLSALGRTRQGIADSERRNCRCKRILAHDRRPRHNPFRRKRHLGSFDATRIPSLVAKSLSPTIELLADENIIVTWDYPRGRSAIMTWMGTR